MFRTPQGTIAHMHSANGDFPAILALRSIFLIALWLAVRQVVTGAASGHLYVWSGRNCVRSLRGHYGPVTAMFSGPYGLISGGKVRAMEQRHFNAEDTPLFSLLLGSEGIMKLFDFHGCEASS